MCIYCSFDQKTRKFYILLFSYFISDICLISIHNYLNFQEFSLVEDFIESISKIIVIIPYFIYKICSKKEYITSLKNKKSISNNNIKDYIIFILVVIIEFLFSIFLIELRSKNNYYEVIVLFYFSLLMKIYTDFKFYKHRIVGLIIFSIFSITKEILTFRLTFNFTNILLNIYFLFLFAIIFYYQQYLISLRNISFYIVCSFYGLIDSIFLIITKILYSELGLYINYKNYKISKFHNELIFKNYSTILVKVLPYFFIYAIKYIISYFIIDNFSIIHSRIIYISSNMVQNILVSIKSSDNDEVLFNSLFIIIKFISLGIYLEIIEIKFCGLNKNTRRNILIREILEKCEINQIIDNEDEEENESILEDKKIEFSDGYLVDIKNIPNRVSIN